MDFWDNLYDKKNLTPLFAISQNICIFAFEKLSKFQMYEREKSCEYRCYTSTTY